MYGMEAEEGRRMKRFGLAVGPGACPLPVKVKTPTTSGNVVLHDGD